jgi:general secretion pathway protein D
LRRTTRTRVAAVALATLAWHLAAFGIGGPQPAGAAEPLAAGGNPFRAAAEAPSLPDGMLAVPSTTAPTASPAGAAAKAQSDQLLLDARRALSVGDLPRAQQFLGKAQDLRAPYEGPGDTPQAVQDAIAEYQETAALRNLNGGANWRAAYSKFLVKQADALLSWNDLDTAARAANEAAQLNPQFSGNGLTPQDVLRRIEQRRKSPASLAVKPQPAGGSDDAKEQTLILLADARAMLAAGKIAEAQVLAGKASLLNVPDSQFAEGEDRPSRLALDLQRASGGLDTLPGESPLPMTATPGEGNYVQAAAAMETGAAMQLAQLPEFAPTPLPSAGEATPLPSDPRQMLEAGEQALRAGDREGALQSFKAAYQQRDQLDVLSQQRLQGHLQMLSPSARKESLPSPDGTLLDSAAEGQSVLARQLSADVLKRQTEAEKLRSTDPKQSLKLLEESRAQVEQAQLSQELKSQLLRRIEMTTAATNKYIEAHKSELELEASNREVLNEVERSRKLKLEIQQKMAQMVDEFNRLVDEHRYAEAEVVANRLFEMAPDELVAQQVNKQAKLIRRERWNQDIIAQSENGVANTFLDIRATSAKALDSINTDYGFGDNWANLKDRKAASELGTARNLKELEIEQKLKTPVLPKYNETPLTKVVEGLSQLAGINIHLDPRGLSQEGVRSDTPITLNLPQEISLRSALTLILEPLHLTYTVKDEVLKITSEQIRDGDLVRKVYPVGDLVIPIPNFVPSNNIGLQGLINDAYAAMGAYGPGGIGGPVAMVANNRPGQPGVVGANGPVHANFAPPGGGPTSATAGGPGGLGGAANADFDSLIDLITSTVEHESWMENGTGEGEIQPFPTNLSLVISQTQRVHEQIADLLEQLRRLQDLQVTIEVRFIRLTDSFFERIGVDFDFDITSRTGLNPANYAPGQQPPPVGPSYTVGLDGISATDNVPNYSVDLDLPFRNSSFNLSAPQFGTPVDVGTFGFAILSDIEAFFVINASQGDRRANVLQAPKVTLFNGQQANVIDSSFRPFVISVIPVVGEFAAAQQPVIVVLSEGTMMTVQAVVSDDRRYVRLTLVPFFSQIGNVETFTFEGSESVSTSTASTDENNGNSTSEDETVQRTRSGTTVQLPTFEVITVSTTVSVPDGGTVLLGGIKRLVEGRNEFGIPLLSKVPYIDRLFRNVGIGRETDSLMMMVTPHIIIQEEEEERLGVARDR